MTDEEDKGPCTCHRGSAKNCPYHTQTDFDAADKEGEPDNPVQTDAESPMTQEQQTVQRELQQLRQRNADLYMKIMDSGVGEPEIVHPRIDHLLMMFHKTGIITRDQYQMICLEWERYLRQVLGGLLKQVDELHRNMQKALVVAEKPSELHLPGGRVKKIQRKR